MAGKYQQPKNIRSILSSIESSEWLLPNIQRKFVWDKEKICNLFDSIMRGYPIGTFMVWLVKNKTLDSTNFFKFLQNYQEKWQETCEQFKPCGARENYYAVVDGQQRLNALYIGYTGSYAEKLSHKRWANAYDESIQPKEFLYINITHKLKDDDSTREYDFAFFSKNNLSKRDDKNQWFKVGDILNFDYIEEEDFTEDDEKIIEQINKLGITNTFDESKKATAIKIIKRLYMVTFYLSIINYYQEEIQDLDKVVDIFVRANSGGVPLAFSDLVMSVTVSQWAESRDKIDSLVKLIFAQSQISIDRDFVLKTCLVLFSSDIKFRVKNFAEKQGLIENIKNNFEKISDAITKTCNFAKQLGLTDASLRAKYALIPIIYYVFHNDFDIDNMSKSKENKQKIAIWLKIALLKGMFGGQPDNVLSKIREILRSNEGMPFPTHEIIENFKNTTKDISIDESFVAQKVCASQYGSADAYLILSLITEMDPQHTYDVDHMFPKSMFTPSALKKVKWIEPNSDIYEYYSDNNNWNTIGNLQLLNSSENKSKNGGKLSDWFKNNPNYNKDLYFVPKEPFTGRYLIEDDDFFQFIEKRRELIIQAVMNCIKMN